MPQEPKQLDELFHDTLKDIYFAEKKILATLPKMAKAGPERGTGQGLRAARIQTQGHVERLEQVFAIIDESPMAKPVTPSLVSLRKARRL